ncbi:MAG: hypothetical protein A2832_00880 [Candidatus Zambryskibacteria bacterium RIFCSPHIGHO2_01_FULL_44_22b]|uniref:Uncharacterized protein n=1 Tax=Candidatus Zambryskibacteria bacterium RIFCSPHIGHO2_01_FULL_44_22b TaxID=1802737 RepID=A0A1G2T0N1_9BACT|nr:MAG: hypothetical protein A2832_00880 [Candidatus Zambryskibacteria bacterium RIFCSPHIGHO2_01_FULL_44_22b]
MPVKFNTKIRILEFVVAGIILDLVENIISIKLTTQAELNLRIFLVTLVIVVPFAILTELVIDHPNFWNKVLRLKK